MNGWITECMNEWLMELVTKKYWMNELMIEWINWCVNKWMNESMNVPNDTL